MNRPLRSVLIGDVDYYPSEYAFGVAQAMTMTGHWHSTVNVRWDINVIAKRLREMSPDVIWGHMLLWAPGGGASSNKTSDLLELCERWRTKRGTKVLLHDGDARDETRYPFDISSAVDLALCNHTADRSVWKVPQLRWPYFAFYQREIAAPVPEYTCDLVFAGRLDSGGIYRERTMLIHELMICLGDRMKVFRGGDEHTLFRTPELAASAGAVLGYGRPGRNGWLDVRVFQYPGAGGILLHDDVGGFLEPGVHYYRYDSGDCESVINALECALLEESRVVEMRRAAFDYVQQHHSATARVRQALAAVGLEL